MFLKKRYSVIASLIIISVTYVGFLVYINSDRYDDFNNLLDKNKLNVSWTKYIPANISINDLPKGSTLNWKTVSKQEFVNYATLNNETVWYCFTNDKYYIWHPFTGPSARNVFYGYEYYEENKFW